MKTKIVLLLVVGPVLLILLSSCTTNSPDALDRVIDKQTIQMGNEVSS